MTDRPAAQAGAGDTGRSHANRDRAESFGQVAEQYDRYRPTYPGDLMDKLAAIAGADPVLDIGAGTGREAVLLAERGVSVTAVEVDPAMAAIARRHGVDVEVAPFEDWDARGRSFALIVCGQAWHWIDPERGPAKAYELLRPGGRLALFWNFTDLDDDAEQRVQAAYRRWAPELERLSVARRGGPGTVRGHIPALEAAGFDVRIERFAWQDRETPADYIARVSTHSDHSTLPAAQLAALQQGLLDELAGVSELRLDYTTDVLWCRPVSSFTTARP